MREGLDVASSFIVMVATQNEAGDKRRFMGLSPAYVVGRV